MGTASPAVVDVFRCIESIEKRRNEGGGGGSGKDKDGRDGEQRHSSNSGRRGKRRSQAADRALRERYYAVLQRKDGRLSLSERIKTLRRMVLAQGLPGDIMEKCTTPRLDSSGGELWQGSDTTATTTTATGTIATGTTTTATTTSAPTPPPPQPPQPPQPPPASSSSRRSSPTSSSAQRQGRRVTRGGFGGGGGDGTASGGSGTSATGAFNDLADHPAAGEEEDQCSLRGLVWKVLLGTLHTDSVLYIRLVAKGPSSEDVKIKEDTFRTFPRDEEFRRRVHEHKLSRINNAYVRLNRPDGGSGGAAAATAERRASGNRGREGGGSACSNDDTTGGGGGSGGGERQRLEMDDVGRRSSSVAVASPGTGTAAGDAAPKSEDAAVKGGERAGDEGKGLYVQGMMVLSAPLLFVMPEVDAFFCFNSLLNQHMPRYVAANLDGVHAGCALVDRVLSVVDPVLFNYLESKFLTANIYAFPLVMSLHACVPPLEEAVKLWDAVFSFGVHLEVLVCVAQCVSLRDTLLQDPNPYRHLNARNLPPLDAELLVSMAFSLIPHLPKEMMDEIAQHPFLEEPIQGDDIDSVGVGAGVGVGGGGR